MLDFFLLIVGIGFLVHLFDSDTSSDEILEKAAQKRDQIQKAIKDADAEKIKNKFAEYKKRVDEFVIQSALDACAQREQQEHRTTKAKEAYMFHSVKNGTFESGKDIFRQAAEELNRHRAYSFTSSCLPDYIYHMTHIDNLDSILDYGLYAHDNPYKEVDISDTTVNARRSRPEPVYRRSIHSYVPFYFNPKNPMLYVRRHLQHNIVILAVDSRLILEEGSLITDGNAASGATRFYKGSIASLDRVHWDVVNRVHYDYIKEKRIRMAETLVPDHVATAHIRKIICPNSFTAARVRRLTDKPAVVDKSFYF